MSFKSSCSFDVTYFSYDEHRCELVFGSLTPDKTLIDIETDERRVGRHKGHEETTIQEVKNENEEFDTAKNI